jgi:hypothetical protein
MDKYDTLEYSYVKCYSGILRACGIFYMSIRNTNNQQPLRYYEAWVFFMIGNIARFFIKSSELHDAAMREPS